ncbi:CsbD family protein [Achromobacter piechaudii]|uniref:CsbD-like protein n=2 Tax=Achromobacter piechaudii TaxID=72556 RepID=D4XDF2_9BURK|nr:CsbD-like protein [Achromobacter piechaudii ATCC 43553]
MARNERLDRELEQTLFLARDLGTALAKGQVPASIAAPVFHQRDESERAMNKDQVKGRVEEAVGKVKEVAGKATGSTSTEVKGTAQKVAGKTQAAYGDAKDKAQKPG